MNDAVVAIPDITYSVAMTFFEAIRPWGCWKQSIDRVIKKGEVKSLLRISEDDVVILACLIKKALSFRHDDVVVIPVGGGAAFHIKTGGRFW